MLVLPIALGEMIMVGVTNLAHPGQFFCKYLFIEHYKRIIWVFIPAKNIWIFVIVLSNMTFYPKHIGHLQAWPVVGEVPVDFSFKFLSSIHFHKFYQFHEIVSEWALSYYPHPGPWFLRSPWMRWPVVGQTWWWWLGTKAPAELLRLAPISP